MSVSEGIFDDFLKSMGFSSSLPFGLGKLLSMGKKSPRETAKDKRWMQRLFKKHPFVKTYFRNLKINALSADKAANDLKVLGLKIKDANRAVRIYSRLTAGGRRPLDLSVSRKVL